MEKTNVNGTTVDIGEIVRENVRRNRKLARREVYDPLSGVGCVGPRREMTDPLGNRVMVPEAMVADVSLAPVADFTEWERIRCRYDFEFWCARCVKIRHKTTGAEVSFVLNYPQRRVVEVLEADRLKDKPMRLIMLKARQWGGSTLVQCYMAWIQSCLRLNWNSLICAHVKDTASSIRGMYDNMLRNYPEDLWLGEGEPRFRPYQRSENIMLIEGRGCRVTVASAERQDSVRGGDFSMAHLSETAFWGDSTRRQPDAFIRAIVSSIPLEPLTLVAMESTANGVGNFFHREWVRSVEGTGDKHPIFVPWYEIEIYRMKVTNPERLWSEMTEYERGLWDRGLTLEMINWYHHRAREFSSLDQMHAEFPTTAEEAFINTGASVFDVSLVNKLRHDCRTPEFVGELTSVGVFREDRLGRLKVWSRPEEGAVYVASVDVGGRSAGADYSVIAVMRVSDGDRPHEIVAQWRGHIDHDLLARRAMMLAATYNDAFLIVESNTLETENDATSPLSVLNILADNYANLYRRQTFDTMSGAESFRVGFHTNRSTKPLLIDLLISSLRDMAWVERDSDACDELSTYCQLSNGSYAAKLGFHDDILMTRALALHAATRCSVGGESPLPAITRW